MELRFSIFLNINFSKHYSAEWVSKEGFYLKNMDFVIILLVGLKSSRHKTSFQRRNIARRRIDVETTWCVYWKLLLKTRILLD